MTLFGVLTLPLQYCLCSVTPLPPPQLTFFRGSRNTSLCPHLPKGLVLSPPPCASFTQPSEPNSSGCHYRRPPWQKYCLDKEQVNTNNPGRRSLLWLSWLRPSELIWCVSRVLPPPPFLPLGPHFNNRRCYVRGGGSVAWIYPWMAPRSAVSGDFGGKFSDFCSPPPTSLGVWCYCREPLRKSQQEVLFLDYLCISVRYPWQQLFSLDFITPLFLFLLLPRAVFCNLLWGCKSSSVPSQGLRLTLVFPLYLC